LDYDAAGIQIDTREVTCARPGPISVSRDMRSDPYISLMEALAVKGLTGQRNLPDQLIVSAQQGAVWPNRGNSFCLSHRQGLWYVSTWLPVRYRVPAHQDVVALCSECMAVETSAMYRVPPELVARFELQEIDDRQYEELFPTEGEGD
jgi:hypothetical protein